MTRKADVIIIGAGHNGLVCAAYLAKAGRNVLVLERATQVGGAAITREFAKGFSVSAGAHIFNGLQPKIIKDLGLSFAGDTIKTVALSDGGEPLIMDQNTLTGSSDAGAYGTFMARMSKPAKVLASQLIKAPPRLAEAGLKNTLQLAGLGWDVRFGLGKKGMQDLLRIAAMDFHHLMDEVFKDEALKGALSLDATLGTALEPRMPGTVFTWLYRLAAGLNSPMMLPSGGLGGVTQTLAERAEALGAQIETGAAVQSISLENGQANGVVLESGETISAPVVISNADPKTTFQKLVGAQNLEAQFANRIHHIRSVGRAAKVHVALNGLPDFKGLDEGTLKNRLLIAPSRRYVELAYNPAKYGEIPENPAMEITIPTLGDPGLAPEGSHVLSAVVQFVPFEAKGGWKKGKEALARAVIETLQAYAPDIKDKMAAIECLTPPDLEAEFGMTGGHWHHGELALDQILMMRPTYGAAQYKTPVDGLYLCGAGSHPGGGVTGAPGHNAAEAVLAGEK